MPIQWTNDLVLGIPEIDAQHLELDRHLALVHDAICEGHPALEEHRGRHREFTERLAGFEDATAREGVTARLAVDVGNWLASWVREHQRYDLQLAAYAGGKDAARPGKTEP